MCEKLSNFLIIISRKSTVAGNWKPTIPKKETWEAFAQKWDKDSYTYLKNYVKIRLIKRI